MFLCFYLFDVEQVIDGGKNRGSSLVKYNWHIFWRKEANVSFVEKSNAFKCRNFGTGVGKIWPCMTWQK